MSQDLSSKDAKYFVDGRTYNCPFCKRRSVRFEAQHRASYDHAEDKTAHIYIVECLEDECKRRSMHLSFILLSMPYGDKDASSHGNYFENPPKRITATKLPRVRNAVTIGNDTVYKAVAIDPADVRLKPGEPVELDDCFFYHWPTSAFTWDPRIPKDIREAIAESENCASSSLLTGASACLRKAAYLFLKAQSIPERHETENRYYKHVERVELLKEKLKGKVDEELIGALEPIHGLTSQEVHEKAWEAFSGRMLNDLLAVLRELLVEVYVDPAERAERLKGIRGLVKAAKEPAQ